MRTLVEYGLANAAAATVLAVIAVLVGLVIRRPAVRNALWVLVLVRLLLPPVWTIPLPISFAKTTPESPVAAPVTPAPIILASAVDEPADLDVWLPAEAAAEPGVALESLPEPPATPAVAAVAPAPKAPIDPFNAIAGVWIVGSVLVAIASARRVVRFRRALRDALPAPADIQQQAEQAGTGDRTSPCSGRTVGAGAPFAGLVDARSLFASGKVDHSDRSAPAPRHESAGRGTGA